jgi:hypothetical protein
MMMANFQHGQTITADAIREKLFKPPRHEVDALLLENNYQTIIKILADPKLFEMQNRQGRNEKCVPFGIISKADELANRDIYSMLTKSNRVKTLYFSREEGELPIILLLTLRRFLLGFLLVTLVLHVELLVFLAWH